MNQTRRILLAIGIFWVVVILAIFFNAQAYLGTARPWLLGNSISWYVGSRVWSAMLFVLGNFAVAILMSHFLWSLGGKWKMPRTYFFFVILLVVALVWLSVFPLGFFDTVDQESIVSYMHKAGSRTMFFAMAMIILLLSVRNQFNKPLRVASGFFLVYAIFCVFSVAASFPGFYAGILLYESSYVLAFMLLVLWYSRIPDAN